MKLRRRIEPKAGFAARSSILWVLVPAPLVAVAAKLLNYGNGIAALSMILFVVVGFLFLFLIRGVDEGTVRVNVPVVAALLAFFGAMLVGKARIGSGEIGTGSDAGTQVINTASARSNASHGPAGHQWGHDQAEASTGDSVFERSQPGNVIQVVLRQEHTTPLASPSERGADALDRRAVPAIGSVPAVGAEHVQPESVSSLELTDALIASLEIEVNAALERARFFVGGDHYANAVVALREGAEVLSAYQSDSRVSRLALRLSNAELTYREQCQRYAERTGVPVCSSLPQ